MIFYDLHVHTTTSDGTLTPQQVIDQAIENHISILSLTDHDTIQTEEVDSKGITLIKGIEISTHDSITNKDLHLLGYNYKTTSHITEYCNQTLQMMKQYAYQQVQALICNGYPITWEEVSSKASKSTSIYKQHIMDVLVEKGIATDIYDDFYQKTFKNNGICQIKREFPSFQKAINAIHQDGGIAILAHPGLSKVTTYLDTYARMEIDGVETFHSSHNKETIELLHCKALQYNWIETGGSDCHGRYGKEPLVGQYKCRMEEGEVPPWMNNN